MAYKQNPGRSPFLKTGRGIPLNFLQNSPLHDEGTPGHTHDDVDWDKKPTLSSDFNESIETETANLETDNPVDKDASGGRSYADAYAQRDMDTYGDLNLEDYTTEAKRQNVSQAAGKGWDAPKTKMTASKGPTEEGPTEETPDLSRRERRIKKAKGKITDITGEGKILTEKEQWKVKKQQKKVKNIEARQNKKKK
jgi:hypothetical protein